MRHLPSSDAGEAISAGQLRVTRNSAVRFLHQLVQEWGER